VLVHTNSVLEIRTFLPDPESSPPDPDPDLALVMYIYQVIVSEMMVWTNFWKNCHDLDTLGKYLLYIMEMELVDLRVGKDGSGPDPVCP
jgi:hypothetical protein